MSDSGRFFQIVLSISECLPENSSLNNELDGFCPVQIGYVEVEIRNLKEDLHTKIFLILFNWGEPERAPHYRGLRDHVHRPTDRPSLVTSPRAPPGEKRSGERSRISWAYSPKRWKTNEIARSLIIT